MKRTTLVAVVGIPPDARDSLVARFSREQQAELIPLRSLRYPTTYSDEYADRLYERIASELRKREPACRNDLLSNMNFVLLYVDRHDGSESSIIRRFGVEALVMPLDLGGADRVDRVTRNQRNEMINRLLDAIDGALKGAQKLLEVITEDVTSRDNSTCLLLPPKTFGKGFRRVQERVLDAARNMQDSADFKKALKRTRTLVRFVREDGRRHFVGKSGRTFRSPGKGSGRHGLAPVWGESRHDTTCVIRGRLRFGVSFDPRFHYDCEIASGGTDFPGCHEAQTVKNATHANVAPNDNVR